MLLRPCGTELGINLICQRLKRSQKRSDNEVGRRQREQGSGGAEQERMARGEYTSTSYDSNLLPRPNGGGDTVQDEIQIRAVPQLQVVELYLSRMRPAHRYTRNK